MYQEIDDPEWEESEAKDRKRAFWLTICLSLILVLIIGALWFVFRPDPKVPEITDNSAAIAAQYRTALSEPSPPLRRARLMDFLETHPDTPHRTFIKAQLSILNAAESESWASLTNAIYNTALPDAEKRIAIDTYIRDWGPVYLGEREEDIKAFTETFATEMPTDIIPSEDITTPEDIIGNETNADILAEKDFTAEDFTAEDFAAPAPNYSTTLSDTVMAGGINRPAREVFPERVPSSNPERIARAVTPSIIPPKIRKNVTPRYPKSAQRRGVEGLVTVALNINAEGRVDIVTIVSVETDRYAKDFAKAAKRAARRTRFFPQTVNGVPTPVSGVIKRYRFEIEP